jgi:thiamine kinase-like enzyme
MSQPKYEVLSNKKFLNSSTYPVEIVTCRLSNNEIVRFFCKCEATEEISSHLRDRGGLEYEIRIYDDVLRHIPLPKLEFYKDSQLLNGESRVLVLQFLEDSETLEKADEPEFLLERSAAWIAQLHRLFENNAPSFVTVYDEVYYRFWLKQVQGFNEIKFKYPWIDELCTFFSENVELLVQYGNTFVHGEYYPRNILTKEKIIYPIDWESAAVAPGQIDLASLIEDWEETSAQNAIEEYKTVRWYDENVPADFDQVLLLSQIYHKFRWISEFPNTWVRNPKQFEPLYKLAKKAGCV